MLQVDGVHVDELRWAAGWVGIERVSRHCDTGQVVQAGEQPLWQLGNCIALDVELVHLAAVAERLWNCRQPVVSAEEIIHAQYNFIFLHRTKCELASSEKGFNVITLILVESMPSDFQSSLECRAVRCAADLR